MASFLTVTPCDFLLWFAYRPSWLVWWGCPFVGAAPCGMPFWVASSPFFFMFIFSLPCSLVLPSYSLWRALLPGSKCSALCFRYPDFRAHWGISFLSLFRSIFFSNGCSVASVFLWCLRSWCSTVCVRYCIPFVRALLAYVVGATCGGLNCCFVPCLFTCCGVGGFWCNIKNNLWDWSIQWKFHLFWRFVRCVGRTFQAQKLWLCLGLSAVFPLRPKQRLGLPANCLIYWLKTDQPATESKYPKNNPFTFENKGCVSGLTAQHVLSENDLVKRGTLVSLFSKLYEMFLGTLHLVNIF